MRKTKLILIEGLPGSGKTSTARYVKSLLDELHIPSRLVLEGDLNQLADYDSAAFLNEEQYREVAHKYEMHKPLISTYTERKAGGYLVYYGKLLQEVQLENTDDFSRFDVYNLPIEQHKQLILGKWSEFALQAAAGEEIYLLECCFLQNPLTIMLGRENEPKAAISDYIHQLYSRIESLNPQLIYLYEDNSSVSFNKVIGERPAEWLEFITWYYTEQGYGKSKGLKGVDGLLKVLELRKTYELELLQELPIGKLLLNKSDVGWTEIAEQINRFVSGEC